MGIIGRAVEVRRDGTLIAGARTKNITINNEPVDITTDDSDGFRELLEESAERHLDISVEGLTKDYALLELSVGGGPLIEEYTVTFPALTQGGDPVVISGEFRFNNFQQGAEYNDAVTFTAELQSTGGFDVVAGTTPVS